MSRNKREQTVTVNGVEGVLKVVTTAAQTPTAGVYSYDASGDFSAINALLGCSISTAAASAVNYLITGEATFSGTTISVFGYNALAEAATDETVRLSLLVHGTPA